MTTWLTSSDKREDDKVKCGRREQEPILMYRVIWCSTSRQWSSDDRRHGHSSTQHRTSDATVNRAIPDYDAITEQQGDNHLRLDTVENATNVTSQVSCPVVLSGNHQDVGTNNVKPRWLLELISAKRLQSCPSNLRSWLQLNQVQLVMKWNQSWHMALLIWRRLVHFVFWEFFNLLVIWRVVLILAVIRL